MATQIGFISSFEEVVKSEATCRKCGGLGYIQSFKALPDGGICYRCDGLGVSGKDRVTTVETVETRKPLAVTFLEDGQSFEDLFAKRQSESAKVKA